jgi:hypothetical protein
VKNAVGPGEGVEVEFNNGGRRKVAIAVYPEDSDPTALNQASRENYGKNFTDTRSATL